jgi:quinol monooxygenase YgiN
LDQQQGATVSDQTPVTVIARFAPAAGRAADLQALLAGMIAPTRAETGCRLYDLFLTQGDPAELVLVERYHDSGALEAHRASRHYRAYRAQLPAMLAKPVDVSVLTPVNALV